MTHRKKMDPDEAPPLTKEEQSALVQFARRQREEESADARLIERYSNRFSIVRSVWAAVCTAVVGLVFGTVYLFTLKADISRAREDLTAANARITANEARIRDLELQMRDKVNRP